MGELKEALKKSKDTAAGVDNIHYQFLKRLPESCLNVLLNVYNDVWESGNFPPLMEGSPGHPNTKTRQRFKKP